MNTKTISLLFVSNLFLGTVRLYNVGIFQLTYQAGFYGIDINTAQLVPLDKLLLGKPLGFIFCRQRIDAGDHLNVFMDGNADASFLGFSVNGSQADLAQTPHRYFCPGGYRFIRLFAGQTVDSRLSCSNILAGKASADTKTAGNYAIQP